MCPPIVPCSRYGTARRGRCTFHQRSVFSAQLTKRKNLKSDDSGPTPELMQASRRNPTTYVLQSISIHPTSHFFSRVDKEVAVASPY